MRNPTELILHLHFTRKPTIIGSELSSFLIKKKLHFQRPKVIKTRPSALDLNNPVVIEKEKPKVEAQASKKKFSGIARTAIVSLF